MALLVLLLVCVCSTVSAQCNCANGTAVSGGDCPSKGTHACKDCDSTHKLATIKGSKGKRCIYKDQCTCPCQNDRGQCGVPRKGSKCASYGDLKWCDSCFKGFAFSKQNAVKRCDVSLCTCKNGRGATGKACPTKNNNYQAALCASCEWEYKLQGGKCAHANCRGGTYYNQKQKGCLKCPTGSCKAKRDCAGVPGGKGKLDRCQVCNGDGKTCARAREAAACKGADANKDAKKVDIEDLLVLLGQYGQTCSRKTTKFQWTSVRNIYSWPWANRTGAH